MEGKEGEGEAVTEQTDKKQSEGCVSDETVLWVETGIHQGPGTAQCHPAARQQLTGKYSPADLSWAGLGWAGPGQQ